MRHSGSTALFNILRLGFELSKIPLASGYSGQKDFTDSVLLADGLRLAKTHEYRDDIAWGAYCIFTTRRDLRDTVASAVRRQFPLLKQIGGPVEYAKHNRALHAMWAPSSTFEFVYEHFMAEPVDVVAHVLSIAGLEPDKAELVHQMVLSLPADDYSTTLLSPQHITDPEHKLSYADTLVNDDITAIEAQHSVWLAHYGYTAKKLPST
jgi:hypothetical protein